MKNSYCVCVTKLLCAQNNRGDFKNLLQPWEKKKFKFPGILMNGLLKEIKNVIQFIYAFEMPSPTDQRNKNVTKIVFLHKILKYSVLILP